MNSPQPEGTIEQRQQYYGQLWHRFNEELPAGLDAVERDVQIAQRTIPQLGLGETSRLLCRSPHTQALLKAGNPQWQDHVHTVVGVAQERTLSAEQCQQGKWVVGVLERLLRDSNTQAFEGDRYIVHQDGHNHSLTLIAKDGRGAILKQTHAFVVQSNLSPQDLKAIKNLDHKLDQQVAERIQSTHSIKLKSQSRGFEVGD